MASVDDRIVRMEFDNASFEKKVGTTLTSLGQLEKALKFEGAKEGFSNIASMGDKLTFGGMSAAIDGISAKFLALSTIAITALANITNKAIDAGIQMAKSLSLDQVMAGFQEYELKMGSIQTIMAGSGEPLEVVNQKLRELNDYSDKTIYSFKDMTSNIGKFTNAGVSLDDSVAAIQGVANVAAVSGANSEEASRAMYNFAQALSKGHVQLVDWKSIELANMGTVEFKTQLLDAAVAMGTLTKEGDKYVTSAGNQVTATQGFNESLTDQWLTTEVLTGTLGDYADETTEIGKKAFAAAQDIKTFSQMMDTTKEAIGSGWSESFEILFGNFEEAKALWSELGGAISEFVGKNAENRNKILQDWKDLGGRTLLIDSLREAWNNLGMILDPIKDAFRDIFPPMTGQRLFELTQGFSELVDKLRPTEETVENIGRIFKGFFSILEIGWTAIKETGKFIGELIQTLTGASDGKVMAFFASIGDFFTNLGDMLVEGGGIKGFFDTLLEAIKAPGPFLDELKDKIGQFWANLTNTEAGQKAEDAFGRVKDRFEELGEAFDKAKEWWKAFKEGFDKVVDVLDKAWDAIKEWVSGLWDKLAEAFSSGDFDKVTDALNTGILASIAVILGKFFKDGLSINLGGGFMDSITGALDQLTGTLKAMQTDIKANALLKIAGAIALLTASVLVLSMIDSAALTKALSAMAVGFAQLMASFAIISKMSIGPSSAASLALLSVGMTMMAGAILLLATAAKSLSDLNWEELATGLTGVMALLAMMVGTVKLLEGQQASMIGAGLGMIAIAVALNILAGAVKIFATMSWGEMAQGFVAVAGGLLIIAGAMRLMPSGLALQAVGLLAISVGLTILAGAMKAFASLDWGEMGKGMVGIAGSLLLIGVAMKLFPPTMPLIGAGLLMVSVALIAIAKAMSMMGGMSWGEIAKGLVAMAGALLILAVAANAMSGALAGAAAMAVMSVSLMLLFQVLKGFASMSWGELLMGLAGIAAIIAVLAAAAMLLTPAIGPMMLLGAALLLIGAGLALFGAGAMFVAKAFEIMAESGAAGSEAIVEALKNIGKAIPAFVTGLAEGLIELVKLIGDAAPEIVEMLMKILTALLDAVSELIPKLLEVVGELITALLEFIPTKYGELIQAGIDMIMALLTGIRDNIGEIVTVVGEIITGFLDAFSEQITNIVGSVVDLWVNFMTSVAEGVGKVASTMMFGIAAAFIKGFVDGLDDAIPGPMKWFQELAGKVLNWIGNVAKTLWNKGVDFISGLFEGITNKASAVINWFLSLAGNVLGWIGSTISTLWGKGWDFISGLLNGITDRIGGVSSFFGGLIGDVLGWIGSTANSLWSKGWGLISGLYDGVKDMWGSVSSWFGSIDDKVKNAVGNLGRVLYNIGRDIINGLWDGLKDAWSNVTGWLGGLAGQIPKLKGPPEKDALLLVNNGMLIMQGLQRGMEDEWDNVAKWLSEVDPADAMDSNLGDNMASSINHAISDMLDHLSVMDEFNPTITPVLDLTRIAEDAKSIGGYISDSTIAVTSANQAQSIAYSGRVNEELEPIKAPAGSGEVKFEQNIYSPTQLSTSDIYKQTRNQITMAKEELSIP